MSLFDLHAKPETLKGYEQRYQVPGIAWEEAKKRFEKTGNRSSDLEPYLAKDYKHAKEYAMRIIRGPFPLAEPLFAKTAKRAVDYAKFVIHDRFPLGEKVIARSAYWAYVYARDVVKGRFPLGEKAIAKDPFYAFYYALYVLGKRFPEAESEIKHDSELRRRYEKAFKIKI